ncbi:glycosyltransferase [Prochlorococcus marinus]|uniref:Glycosyl transferase, group 1 n=1 Tax=Prochlorococcus marinus (strain MIT 9303) TaxID=59922 RepID=A2CCT4_PROM3|nr:glycosyltransferase [Prochlorococcus marinus]ABM79294.1 Glycosyl transferase, group 1 [Prochlorococcus marinus str. MIT 9303]
MSMRLLVFAPTRRAPTETFVRANLQGLPFEIIAYFGDEQPLSDPGRLAYGLAILVSKALTRLGLLRLATLPGSLVAWCLIRRHQPDVLMTEFGFHAVRVMEAAAWSDTPLIVHFRGSDASAQNRLGLLKDRYRRLMVIVSGIIVKSQPMRRTLLALGAPNDHLIVSPSGADERLFHGADPGRSSPLLVAVGRFVAKKGPLQTIRAFAAMRQSLPEPVALSTKLVMLGDGPLLAEARQLVEALALGSAVILPGLADRQRVAELLRQARCFVQHSQVAPDGDREGSPVAVMEAQLSGLPVVATRHEGIPEVVEDGVSGFLVDEGDLQGMAAAMARLIVEPDLAARLGAAGKRRAAANFTARHHLEQIAALLRKVIQESR